MDFEELSRIQRVEAPPFLYTRIQQRIERAGKENMPMSVALAINLLFVLLLIVDFYLVAGHSPSSRDTESYAESIHLTYDLSLYK